MLKALTITCVIVAITLFVFAGFRTCDTIQRQQNTIDNLNCIIDSLRVQPTPVAYTLGLAQIRDQYQRMLVLEAENNRLKNLLETK